MNSLAIKKNKDESARQEERRAAHPADLFVSYAHYNSAYIERNGKSLQVEYLDPQALAIPNTPYYLRSNATISDLAQFIGLKTYDTALPQSFWDEYNAKHGQPPRGVWSYDEYRTFGAFVSVDEMMKKLGELINDAAPQPKPQE